MSLKLPQPENAAGYLRAAGRIAMKNGVRNMRRWDTEIRLFAASVRICKS
jgi:hypothetical protein